MEKVTNKESIELLENLIKSTDAIKQEYLLVFNEEPKEEVLLKIYSWYNQTVFVLRKIFGEQSTYVASFITIWLKEPLIPFVCGFENKIAKVDDYLRSMRELVNSYDSKIEDIR